MTIKINPGITLGPGVTVKVPRQTLYYFATNVITISGGVTTNPAFLTAKQLYIGTSGYENRNMQGKIALVLMYNRVLTQEENLVNYNHYKTRFGLT